MSNPHLQPTDYTVLKHVINIPKTTHMYKYIHVSFHYKVAKQLEIPIKCKDKF